MGIIILNRIHDVHLMYIYRNTESEKPLEYSEGNKSKHSLRQKRLLVSPMSSMFALTSRTT